MVDANGKPYQNQNPNNCVNNVAEQPAAAPAKPTSDAGYEDAIACARTQGLDLPMVKGQ
jgi:urocanate hydratase